MNIPSSSEGPSAPVQVSLRTDAPADSGLDSIAPPPAENDPEAIDWRRIWSAVKRRRWVILAIVCAGTAAGVIATRFSPPRYRAEATVWIDSRDPRDNGPAPIQPGRLLGPEAWLDLARSYAVLDEAVRAGRLYLVVPRRSPPALFAGFAVADTFRPGRYALTLDHDGSTFRLLTADGLELDRARSGDSIGARLGIRWAPPGGLLTAGGTAKFEIFSLRDAATRLADQLQLHIDEQGNLLRFDMEGSDPDRIARTLESVTDRFVTVAADLKHQKLTELTGKLDDQLAAASDALVQAESTYEAFRTRTIALPSEHATAAAAAPAGGGEVADPVTDRYFTLQASRDAVRRDREALDRALRSGPDGGLSIEALNAIPAVKGSRELGPALDTLVVEETGLRGLRMKYSDQHPLVIQATERVSTLRDRTIPALARSLLAELQHREGLVSQDVSAASAALRGIPARSLEEARLRRTVALAEDLHNTLQQRHEEAQLAEASAVADTRILDHAEVPRTPIRDTAVRLMLLAVFGSLGLALVSVVLLDRADPKFNYPSQITRELHLPILGAIPHLGVPARVGEAARLPAGAADGAAPLTESLRGIRMALLTEAQAGRPILFTISSPGSGDGKSFISSHLAYSFAEAGFATVLVDGDVRRGHLHRRFNAPRRPGLCDLLQGTGTLDTALCPTDYPDLTLLPCGARTRRAPELLAGPEMGRVIDALRRRFQVVVVDSPPLTAGIDPYVLSVATGRLLLVMRSGVSHREMMAAKLGVLERMPIDLMGVVMNDVPPDPSYGYYTYYLEGYDARDEERMISAANG